MATFAVSGRADLTDAQWAVLALLLPRDTGLAATAEVDQTAAH